MTAKDQGKIFDRLIARPGKRIKLSKDFNPGLKPWKLSRTQAEARLHESVDHLAALQDKLYAQDRWSVLIIFQAMDAAGKDGTIKHVMSGLNPQGCQVYSFKAPSAEELDHDYLWRCSKALPERGRIGIFNRSYYEEVLVTRVHPEIIQAQKLPDDFRDKKIYARRYEEINAFERYLHLNGALILKFFLHVSKQEQKKRFLERIQKPEKNWKFSLNDAQERAHWKKYMQAYEDCFRATSTNHAPWYIIPADDKPTMRLLVAGVIARAMKGLKLAYPEVSAEHRRSLLEAKKMLVSEKD
jgi:PPK2 family polyphosphate:nucleotide phosphotransferase